MLKAIPYIVKLHMCKHVDQRVSRVAHFCQTNASPQKTTFSQLQERDPCQQPDPGPPPPKDERLFYGTLAVLLTVGGFMVYAKHNPFVRDWLSIQYPWFDDLIAVAYQENKTYTEHGKDFVAYLQDWVSTPPKPRLCDSAGNPLPQPQSVTGKWIKLNLQDLITDGQRDSSIGNREVDQIELARFDYKQTTVSKSSKPDKKVCKKAEKPGVQEASLKTICEIEKCLISNGDDCVNNYWTAREACKYYNGLVDETLTNFTLKRLKLLRPAMEERFKLLNEHVCAAETHKKRLCELERLMECGVSAPQDIVDNTNAMLKEYKAKIQAMQIEYTWEADRSVSLDKKWQIVEKMVNRYIEENEELFKGTKYDVEKPSIAAGDIDLLLIHTLRYKKMLEDELKALSQRSLKRSDRGMASLSQDEPSVKNREKVIQSELKKKQGENEQNNKKKLEWQKNEVEKDMQKKLKEQKKRYEDSMEAKLKEKEEEATQELERKVKAEVEAQKRKFARELEEVALKVKAVEDKLNARLKAERETKRSQTLYSNAVSLLAKTTKGDHHVCIAREIRAIEAAACEGDGDKLVKTVLKSIPEDLRKNGVVPECHLKQRFHVMEKTAKDVALVEAEGSPGVVYIASWLQSSLLSMKLPGIPQKDIDNPIKCKKEMEDLDTFDRLNYARYWVEQGNLAPATYYVDSMEGASRVAADPWYKDAKDHLVIKQAAQAIIAHANALALQSAE